ncbi:8563_t:CDS:1, partial [Entrophospora sp. SA101]
NLVDEMRCWGNGRNPKESDAGFLRLPPIEEPATKPTEITKKLGTDY